MSENLKLWDSVQATDPKYTKAFSRAGGFRGTAINATYQIRRATEQWGPIGGKWGCSIVSSDFVPGADGDVVHVALIDFWHPAGRFQTFGQTTFVGSNKNGKFTDEEAPKKSLTDAITKALSMLGFSADVHLGLFDDNKYVNDMKQQFDDKKSEEKPEKKVSPISGAAVKKDAFDALDRDQQRHFMSKVEQVRVLLDQGNEDGGYDLYAEFRDSLEDTAHKAALRGLFSSAEQSILTKQFNKRKEKEAA